MLFVALLLAHQPIGKLDVDGLAPRGTLVRVCQEAFRSPEGQAYLSPQIAPGKSVTDVFRQAKLQFVERWRQEGRRLDRSKLDDVCEAMIWAHVEGRMQLQAEQLEREAGELSGSSKL